MTNSSQISEETRQKVADAINKEWLRYEPCLPLTRQLSVNMAIVALKAAIASGEVVVRGDAKQAANEAKHHLAIELGNQSRFLYEYGYSQIVDILENGGYLTTPPKQDNRIGSIDYESKPIEQEE